MEAVAGLKGRMRDGRRWLAPPEMWSRRRIAGEAVLAALLLLFALGAEDLVGRSAPPALIGAAVVVLSLLRRRFPVSVLLLVGAPGGVVVGFSPLLVLVGWSAGRRIEGAGRALGAFSASFALYFAFTVWDSWPWVQSISLALLPTLTFLVTVALPGLVGRYLAQRRSLVHALQEYNAQLLRERAMVVGQARLRERQRIAQDMHDSLGHRLALISVHTGALEVDPDLTERQREVTGVLREASVTAMHELREVVGILRDGVEAPEQAVDETGRAARGIAGIQGLVDSAAAAGTAVELRCPAEARPLAPAADHAAYRIVQEALTNAYKHAPDAAIAVELRFEPDSFVVEIVNGPGARPADDVVSGGQGLAGLHERARLVGGMVHAGPTAEGGFRVAGVLPYGGDYGGDAVEGAPFVDAADDFRQQSGAAGPGKGGRFKGWAISERELAVSRGKRSGFAVGCGIAVGVVVALLLAVGVGIYFLVGSLDKGMIEPEQYHRVKVGTSEQKVRDMLPSGDTVMTSGLDGKGPKTPEGAECLVLMSSELGEDINSEPVFRFCFKDGKLIEKKSYEVRR
ncbi:sensor histidine kinase [Streptomyces sp. NPDC050504]|uniref:sensor histidine kinase n=1 Tax=Streptomyces sp. NPDC050504 TaxID=3365618 RepID=UPI0037ABCA3C